MDALRIVVRDKRQVTLPAELCKELGIEPGDTLVAEVENGKLVMKASRKAALDALQEIQKAFKDSGVTLEELLESGREIRKEVFRETYPELAEKHGI